MTFRLNMRTNQAESDTLLDGLREDSGVQEALLNTGLRVWVVARYAEAKAALLDSRLVKDPRKLPGGSRPFGGRRHPEDAFAVLGRHALNTDGAEHRRLRELLAECLSPSMVEQRRAQVEEIIYRGVTGLGRATRPDLVTGFANPVLAAVLGEIVGIEPELMAELVSTSRIVMSDADPQAPEMRDAYERYRQLVLRAVAEHDEFPADGTLLKRAFRDYHPRKKLSLSEITTMLAVVIFAGTNTSATLIAYGAAVLSTRPDLVDRLLESEQGSAAVVEEVLRYHPSAPFASWRFATEDVELGGVVIPQGATVLVALAAANRDPRAFDNANEVDLTRIRLPRHLSFGHGPHFCVGAPLARSAAGVALQALFVRYPQIIIAGRLEDLRWSTNLGDRHLSSLPVVLEPEAGSQ
ncbi:Cytochrome P450 [Amycolatopsis pretoriensis]|uniref:Cytochrome P450 n=1 Tax=Amycolatopsis pretoriensis TaxID=218821 RepID=A0A1H5RK69_9PSEU|nr:cytochrome P450 [Amycolatopsis pretoriensis]SEF38098.1 Cytochrome P450 [Amycolatopsis pretoriensis]